MGHGVDGRTVFVFSFLCILVEGDRHLRPQVTPLASRGKAQAQGFLFGLNADGRADGYVHISMANIRDRDNRRADCWDEHRGWVTVRKKENRGDLVGIPKWK